MKLQGHSNPCLCSECTGHNPENGRAPLISLCDITIRRDEKVILEDVNLRVDRGDFIAITGPNGGGKTTLLRIILGLISPTGGKVVFYSPEGNPSPLPPSIGYLPQKNTVDSHFPVTVRDVIASGLLSDRKMGKEEKLKRVEETLLIVDLVAFANHPIGRLSGGQLQRALFGRAIIRKPQVLILDEPLSYIDKKFEAHFYNVLAEIARDTTILLVSHEMSGIAKMANRHIIVDRTLYECTANHALRYSMHDSSQLDCESRPVCNS